MLSKPVAAAAAGGARCFGTLGRLGGATARGSALALSAAPPAGLYGSLVLGRAGGALLVAPSVRLMSLFGRQQQDSRYSRSSRGPSSSELSRMEEAANGRPHDPGAQLPYLVGLQRVGLAEEIIRRVESAKFAVDERVLGEYVAAVARSRGLSDRETAACGERVERAWREVGDARECYIDPNALRAAVGGSGGLGSALGRSLPAASPFLNPPSAAGGGLGSLFASSGSSASGRRGGEDPYWGGSGGWGGSSSSSGGWGSGSSSSSSSSSFPGGGGGARGGGSRVNPLFVEVIPAKPTFWSVAGKLLYIGVVVAILYPMVTGKGGGMGPLAQLTGGSTEEVTEIPAVRFGDVKGVDEAKGELEDVVNFLRDPEKYRRLGAKVPRGVLLTGPPGTGKTLLARAVAGEAGCHFYSKSASEFDEMLVGLGARRVRDLFTAAKTNSPAIIFIDEIDALGGKRKVSIGSGSERQTLNQLLSSMDGFSKNENVIVIAATNSPEILDPALIRPGRFDTTVNVPLPDVKGRREIIELYLKKVLTSGDINAELLAKATPGFSGAQIEAMVNQAALLAANRGAEAVEMQDFEEARDKVIMGPAAKSRVNKPETMRLTAYHEGGHTLTALLTKCANPLHKVTILPRGFSGGATYFLPQDDEMRTRERILAEIDVSMGGRAAEELIFGTDKITTGAGMDMRQASDLARKYCMAFSMSDLGLTSYADGTAPSPERQALIDAEVEKILQASYARVRTLLSDKRVELERLAAALLEYETLSMEECHDVIAGRPLSTPAGATTVNGRKGAAKPAAGGGGGAAAGEAAKKGGAAAGEPAKKGGLGGIWARATDSSGGAAQAPAAAAPPAPAVAAPPAPAAEPVTPVPAPGTKPPRGSAWA